MKRMTLILLACVAFFAAGAEEAAPSLSSKRVDTLKYGIEPQVIELLSALKAEKNSDLTAEILVVFDTTTSPKLQIAILEYLSAMGVKDAERRAVDIVKGRDELPDTLVGAAFSYLIAIESTAALGEAVEILREDEKRYLLAAIKTIGAAGSDDEADALKAVYESEGREPAIKEEIILALGKMEAFSSYDLLASIVSSDESTKTLRMYACSALGELGDDRAVKILTKASVASDPNVRAAAIAALGRFKSGAAAAAIREGLRDAHVLPRIAAAKAAGIAGDAEAIPYLEYKASNDPEKSVREAAIEALAAIGGARCDAFLSAFLADTKNSIPYRGAALQAIVAKGGSEAREKARAAFLAAQGEKDRALFTAFAKAAASVDAPNCEPFVVILLADKDFSMRLGAIAWADRNKATGLVDTIKAMAAGDASEAVRRRAAQALERLSAS